MLPKNSLRALWMKNVIVYDEAGHDLYHLGLPQFADIEKIDYNKLLDGNLSPETHQIVGKYGDDGPSIYNIIFIYIIKFLICIRISIKTLLLL